MDLDNIKKSWQQAKLTPTIDDNKIQKMLDNKGQSAFNSIIRYEKIGVIALIVCLLLAYPLCYKYELVFIVYFVSCFLGLSWQLYKHKLLKKANIAEASITEVSKFYYKYRRIILNEMIIGLIWFFSFMALLGYFELSPVFDTDRFQYSMIAFVISIFIGILIIVIFYKKFYWNNLQKIKKSLTEIQDFENE